MTRLTVLLSVLCLSLPVQALANDPVCQGAVAVCDTPVKGGFPLITHGQPVPVFVETSAEAGVTRVAADFASDLEKISGQKPELIHDLTSISGDVVVIAELGHSALVEDWTKRGLIDAVYISGKWESYSQVVVQRPEGGQALVIFGADKRGAIYGTYDISARMGVSPWYWWADVPVARKSDVYVTPGERHDAPVVKYRGFFINDEEPSFGGWAREKFGGINHQMYAHLFELELRLKGNYLWPAMWGKAFADDDPLNQKTADDYGIIMGTSHHEPMMRAQDEWHRNQEKGITGGKWDYTTNAANLRTFWRDGIERAKPFEGLVTIGMRGDGDEPMAEGTATHLLESIVADQRQIIADVTGKPADQTPQVWALYKEVQDYYDHGMSVPDDVTLLFSDDNWGQIRRLPDPKAAPRAGGYGIYYHFDYVGGPRNYKWLNTNQIEKTWQQMELANEAGANRLWIVNVGDLKPMEYPLSFFLDMAWNPKVMTPEALRDYPVKWAEQQFGPEWAFPIGNTLTHYTQFNARRKPELLDTGVVSEPDYDEMTRHYDTLRGIDSLADRLPASAHDAFFQLVQYPVDASANLYRLYAEANYSHSPDVVCGNQAAEAADAALAEDARLTLQYNALGRGRWNHMMDQTHIGYDNWQEPKSNVAPAILRRPEVRPPKSFMCSDFHGRVAELPLRTKAGGLFQEERSAERLKAYIAIEAEHYSRKFDGHDVHWQTIPDLGRTLSSVISLPQLARATTDQSVRLEYDIRTIKTADATLNLYLAPTLDTAGRGGLRIGVTIDTRPMQTLIFNLKPDAPDWNAAVSDNIVVLKAPFKAMSAGKHTIKIFRIDSNVVLERLVLDMGGLKSSYLGPPESDQK